MMKTTSQQEKTANPLLSVWDTRASPTRQHIECSFGILKMRFEMLKFGVRLHHEDVISRVIMALLIIHNLCIDEGSYIEHFLPADELEEEGELVTSETQEGKRQRDALLYYVVNNLG